jgi:hypothetical protein
MDAALALGMLDLEHHNPAARKARRVICIGEVLLEATHGHLAHRLRRGLDPAREAMRVQQLKQRGKRVVIAVVGCCGQEQAVFAVGREGADRLGTKRVPRPASVAAGGRTVVNLVHDQYVVAARNLGVRRQHLAQQPHAQLALEPVDRDDQPRIVRERVGTDAARAAQLTQQRAVDDPELEAELLTHLVAPLQLQRGWTDDQRRAGTVAQQQLLNYEARLDRLAKADVVCDQERGAGRVDRANNRLELVVLDHDAAAKRRLQGTLIGARDGAPTDRIQKGVQLGGSIYRVRGQRRKLGALPEEGAWLDLPDDLQLLPGGVVVDRYERDEMLNGSIVQRRL